jgi:hypothetical protein
MRQLLYVSSTSREFPDAELQKILETARRKNGAAGITGMLLYLDGGFLQVLEGDDAAVAAIYADIQRDERHWGARTLLDQGAPRAFAEWSMGFERIQPELASISNVFRITRDAIAGRLTTNAPTELATLLRTFYRVQAGNDEVS